MAQETDLWRRWRATRDGDAFAALVVAELPRAVAVARGTGCDPCAAEDAVQDALVALAQESSDVPGTLGVRTWLLRATRDRARSTLRAGRRRRRRETVAARREAVVSTSPGLEAAEIVERALATLDEDDREAVRLRHVLDLDYRAVATVLGTTEGTARVRVHRAIERLRARLGGDPAMLLAAMPLPAILRPEAVAAHAVSQAAISGAAVSGLILGGAAMGSAKAAVALGVVAFAAGAGTTFVVRDVMAPVEPIEARAPAPGAAEPQGRTEARSRPGRVRGDAVPPGDRVSSPETSVSALATRADPLADLAPTADEREWLRSALATERQRRAQSAIRPGDTGPQILDRWLAQGANVEPLLASFAAASAHVPAAEGQAFRIDTPGAAPAPPADARIVEFGPGRFTLGREWRTWTNRRAGTDAIAVRGAGMDRTTLVVAGDFLFVGDEAAVTSVRLSDFTAEGTDNLIDVRGAVGVVIERVRVDGWQDGGHSSPLGISGRAFIACHGCEFLGTGGAGVLSLRGPGLAVLESCVIDEVPSAVLGGGAASGGRASVVRVLDCTFTHAALADSRIRPGRDLEVSLGVRGGTVSILGPKATEAERAKAWGAEYANAVEGVAFSAAPVWFTVGDAIRALELAEESGIRDVVYVSVTRGRRGAPPQVDFGVFEEGKVVRRTRCFTPAQLTLPAAEPERGVRGTSIKQGEIATVLPIRELLRRSGIAESEPFASAEYGGALIARNGETTPAPTYVLSISTSPRERVSIEARTGEKL